MQELDVCWWRMYIFIFFTSFARLERIIMTQGTHLRAPNQTIWTLYVRISPHPRFQAKNLKAPKGFSLIFPLLVLKMVQAFKRGDICKVDYKIWSLEYFIWRTQEINNTTWFKNPIPASLKLCTDVLLHIYCFLCCSFFKTQ